MRSRRQCLAELERLSRAHLWPDVLRDRARAIIETWVGGRREGTEERPVVSEEHSDSEEDINFVGQPAQLTHSRRACHDCFCRGPTMRAETVVAFAVAAAHVEVRPRLVAANHPAAHLSLQMLARELSGGGARHPAAAFAGTSAGRATDPEERASQLCSAIALCGALTHSSIVRAEVAAMRCAASFGSPSSSLKSVIKSGLGVLGWALAYWRSYDEARDVQPPWSPACAMIRMLSAARPIERRTDPFRYLSAMAPELEVKILLLVMAEELDDLVQLQLHRCAAARLLMDQERFCISIIASASHTVELELAAAAAAAAATATAATAVPERQGGPPFPTGRVSRHWLLETRPLWFQVRSDYGTSVNPGFEG